MPSITRKIVYNTHHFRPFRDSPPINFAGDLTGPHDVPLKILFMRCGDIQNVLHMVAETINYHQKTIFLNDVSAPLMARNILLFHILFKPHFNSTDQTDLNFLWDVWYSLEWNENTKTRCVSELKELVCGSLPFNIKFLKKEDKSMLVDIWNYWLTSCQAIPTKTLIEMRAMRRNFITENWRSGTEGSIRDCDETSSLSFSTLALLLADHLGLPMNLAGYIEPVRELLSEELMKFINTGNCSNDIQDEQKSCINPTLLEPFSGCWLVHYLACPFLGYLPIKIPEGSDYLKFGVAKRHCLSVLQDLIAASKKDWSNVSLTFHIGDPLQLCFEELAGQQFQIVDATGLNDSVGLANLLLATSDLLCDRCPWPVLATRSTEWRSLAPSLAGYVVSALAAPLTLIPTLYGLRPVDPLMLTGDEDPLYVAELQRTSSRARAVPHTLRWTRATPRGLSEVRLPPSSDAVDRFGRYLQRRCFFTGDVAFKCCTPSTYDRWVHWLARRLHWTEPETARELTPELPPPFRLTWRTLRRWRSTDDVLRLSATVPSPPLPETAALRLVLVSPERVPRSWRSFDRSDADDAFWKDVHFVDDLECDVSGQQQQNADLSVSFALTPDHGLADSTVVFLLDVYRWNQVAYLGSMADFESCSVRRPPQDLLPNHAHVSKMLEEDRPRLTMDELQEYPNRYEFQIGIAGLSGTVTGWIVSRDFESEQGTSSKQLNIKVDQPRGVEPLRIFLPWPVDVTTSAEPRPSEDGRSARLVVAKALTEPWPDDIQHRPKWLVDHLRQWERTSDLALHVAAQFSFTDSESRVSFDADGGVEMAPTLRSTLPDLDVVRLIIGRLLTAAASQSDDSNACVTVAGPDSDDWRLRLHHPVRVSPSGVPLLVVSAHRQSPASDHLKIDVPWWDTGRNAVRERILSVDSPSQAALWRYVLHSNASRMTPTAWQRRHLPAGGGGGAWLATFVSPLYVDGPDCGPADGWRLDGVAFDWAGVDAVASAGRCDHCGAQRSHVKRCGRCRAVKYCGVPCQRAHWPRHKTDCRS